MQMFTHGLITGMLFIMVGLIYDRTHTREIGQMSGLLRQTPFIGVFFYIAGFAALGLPSLGGFVSEVLVFLGSFDKYIPMTILAVVGVLLGAGYMLWMLQRILMGPPMERWNSLKDATAWWEQLPVYALTLAIIAVGVYPRWIVDVFTMGITPIAGRLA
jgi:NADH-quinone oxidoreductase subunit M